MLKKTDRNTKSPPVVMLPIRELYLATEAPKNFHLAVRNSSGSPLTDAELKASIYTKGIIQPLIFKEEKVKVAAGDGVRKFVVAGNRRLRFLREIFENSPDAMVQAQNVDDFDGDWREIAMDTNLSLPPHLVERYELIVTLVKDLKLSPEDARLRYGMTPRQFNQVMALGKMAPVVREKWRLGEIDAKTAQAFTLEPDPKEQERIFEGLSKRFKGGRIDARDVREKVIPANQREAGKFVTFVGIDVCKKERIVKQEDLFSTSHTVTDIKALNKLVGDKQARICSRLIEEGWSWAVSGSKIEGNQWSYGSIEPAEKSEPTAIERRRLTEIAEILKGDDDAVDYEALESEAELIVETAKQRGFTEKQRAKSGCFVKINHDGTLVIEYGRTKPEDRKKVAASERPKAKAKPKSGKTGEPVLSAALATRLSEQLQNAGVDLLKVHHDIAVSALIAGFASGGSVIDVQVSGAAYTSKTSDFTEVFSAALKSTSEQRAAMLAQIAAQALSLPLDNEGIADLFEAMKGPSVVKAINAAFDAKDYFSSVSGEAIVESVGCAMGADHAAKVAKMDRVGKAKFATANVPPTGWLPKPLRTVWYTGPVETTAGKPEKKKTAAKAAPAKRKAGKKSAKK